MADELSVAIERLRTSTQRLNEICDSAAQTVRDTEAFLDDIHAGVGAWVEVKRIYEDDEGRRYNSIGLSYGRYKTGQFRIQVTNAPDWAESDEDVTFRPWSECSRDEKLESFEKLPALLVELAKRVDKRTANAEQTVTKVNSLLQLPKKRKGG